MQAIRRSECSTSHASCQARFCTAVLGDLGADVLKIEAPEGDSVRRQGAIRDGLSPGISPSSIGINVRCGWTCASRRDARY